MELKLKVWWFEDTMEIQTISQVVPSCIYTPKGVTLEGTMHSH